MNRFFTTPTVDGHRSVGHHGAMDSRIVTIRTGSTEVVADLTRTCSAFLTDIDAGDGLLNVWVPHATAGIAIIETGAGSDDDLLAALDHVLPRGQGWHHQHGSPGHGRDHVLPAFVAPSATIPVDAGTMALGTWQSICLVDTNVDNPARQVRLSFVRG